MIWIIFALAGLAVYCAAMRFAYAVMARSEWPRILTDQCSHDFHQLHRGRPCHPVNLAASRRIRIATSLWGPFLVLVMAVYFAVLWRQPLSPLEEKDRRMRAEESLKQAERELAEATAAMKLSQTEEKRASRPLMLKMFR